MDPILGSVFLWPLPWAPKGFALCQGQLLNIKTNVALYSLIGNKYGGDGVNTFALPDFRGRCAVNENLTTGIQVGQYGGSETVALNNTTFLPPHQHSISNVPTAPIIPATPLPAMTVTATLAASTNAGTTNVPGPSGVPAEAPDLSSSSIDYFMYGTPDATSTMPVNMTIPTGPAALVSPQPTFGTPTGNPGATGGSTPHPNMQPFLTMNFIIAITGLYPSRP